jgi:hypothetical protein
MVATHILDIYRNGSSNSVANDSARKLAERKKMLKILFELSDVVRKFIVSHVDDDAAILYAHKVLAGLDATYELNPGGVEKSAGNLLKNIKLYLERYDKR